MEDDPTAQPSATALIPAQVRLFARLTKDCGHNNFRTLCSVYALRGFPILLFLVFRLTSFLAVWTPQAAVAHQPCFALVGQPELSLHLHCLSAAAA